MRFRRRTKGCHCRKVVVVRIKEPINRCKSDCPWCLFDNEQESQEQHWQYPYLLDSKRGILAAIWSNRSSTAGTCTRKRIH